MSEERRKILEMLGNGSITVDEAERLLNALGEVVNGADPALGAKPKYLRVQVEPMQENSGGDRVNVRVPLNLIRAGLKWAALIPQHAQHSVNEAMREKGMDFDINQIKPEDLEEIIVNLNDLQVEVDGKDRVRVFCE